MKLLLIKKHISQLKCFFKNRQFIFYGKKILGKKNNGFAPIFNFSEERNWKLGASEWALLLGPRRDFELRVC